jgi:hypothetical protein
LSVVAVSDEALADVSPVMGEVRFAMAREGKSQDRFLSNQQLKLDIRGQGLCEIDIEFHERGRLRMISTRRIRATLPHRYVSDHALPVVGRPGEARNYFLKVNPLVTRGCHGRTFIHEVTVVNHGAVLSREPASPLHISVPAAVVKAVAGAGAAGGAEVPSNPPPASGAITTLTVPGGSMTEGAGQQLQLDGTGTCLFDLKIQHQTSGSGDGTYPVVPARPMPSTLTNGLEFPMLSEGSYIAIATGKPPCTGTPSIHFKVLPPPVVNKDPNAPSFKQPANGATRRPTDVPDGTNVYFELNLPSALKTDDMSVGCCELEFNYRDPSYAWQPNVESGPTEYPELKTAPAMRSISYFTNGIQWRVRARGYKWQTEFPWSDWVEFKIYQQ